MNIESFNIYIKPTKDIEEKLWNDATFIFDSSALLNFYYIPTIKQQEIFNETFEKIKDRLWIPNHVEFEFLKNRESVLTKPINEKYSPLKEKYLQEIEKSIKKIANNVKELKDNTVKKDKHPYIEQLEIDEFNKKADNFNQDFIKFKTNVLSLIEKQIENIRLVQQDDIVLNSFVKYFKVGRKYSFSEIIEIVKEGKLRYEYNIPPGYKDIEDNDKSGIQIFGDLIIWKQIIEFASEKKSPVILIIDDLKEDWCKKEKKNPERIDFPHFDLIKEISDIAGVQIWFYSLPQFLHFSMVYLKSNINDNLIDTIAEEIKNNTKAQYLQTIEITANREDEEPWRIERLNDVAKYVYKSLGELEFSGLHDHKGNLTVTWKKHPTNTEKEHFETAWEAQNELAENVEHIIKKYNNKLK